MSATNMMTNARTLASGFLTWGMFWLVLAVLSAGVIFQDGLRELLRAWQVPEYSHGPLIPILSAFLFLRHLKDVPVRTGPVDDRWPGVLLMVLALLFAVAGSMIEIGDIVAYGLILWVGALLLIAFGWRDGWPFWPAVLHLVFMLPLPGAVYYGVSIWLQGVSSELGVAILHMLRVPVYLEGNIIDLGEYRLHVAEACSGLRYLFPIMSFSYIFATLYQGPVWHKAALLLAAAPITVVLNSVRIAIAGVIVQHWGVGWVEGFTHFFEGWVIFLTSVGLLFLMAWVMVRLRRPRVGLVEALDLDTSGIGTQMLRIRLIEPSRALIAMAVLSVGIAAAWQAVPAQDDVVVPRDPFGAMPSQLGDWRAAPGQRLDADVERILGADDYHATVLTSPTAAAPVDFFMVWYRDQSRGGVHSPEVCLPGGGWEIAELEQLDKTEQFGGGQRFTLNRAVIQQGTSRQLAYYWFEQQGQRTASGFEAKLQLMVGKLTNGRNDSGMVRLITPIRENESLAEAEARLQSVLPYVLDPLPRFFPPV
ncbi:VPLPA-CTERM-specific exosortase XrtD [Rhodobaculum claviforme]|uniref:VPLPA-CTERM-specific exosortase XrtD n=1 Tax=Rhodobaculum claviforme TaxID=1549854 RepID=A0A934WKS0_9RHOB|nr:VPLPA-CTERM-specific exosortase XrtD [Rhodobaculum claviforme]MBK5928843.1 VPLPA-CTERM-specific exosortase XrtD [Rhodobaculum claviforme]